MILCLTSAKFQVRINVGRVVSLGSNGTERFGSIDGIGGRGLVCSVVRKDRAERFYSIDRCGRGADCAWMLKIMEGTMGFRVIGDS